MVCFPKSFADYLCLFFYQLLMMVIHTLPFTYMFSCLQILTHWKQHTSWNRTQAKGCMRVLEVRKRSDIPRRSISVFFPGSELKNLWEAKIFFQFCVSMCMAESLLSDISRNTCHIAPSNTFQMGFQPAEQFGSNNSFQNGPEGLFFGNKYLGNCNFVRSLSA